MDQNHKDMNTVQTADIKVVSITEAARINNVTRPDFRSFFKLVLNIQ